MKDNSRKIAAYKFGVSEPFNTFDSISVAGRVLFRGNRLKSEQIQKYASGERRSPISHPEMGNLIFKYVEK